MSQNKQNNNKVKIHIKKGDTVLILSGTSKGKQGKVLSVDRRKYRAIVEGQNIRIKHTKPIPDQTDGGRVEEEGPIHISNLMVVDPKSGEPTRVGRKRSEGGRLVRYSKKTGDIID